MSRHGLYTAASIPRNPWSGVHSESHSTSTSSQTYHILPPNHYVQVEPHWEAEGSQFHQVNSGWCAQGPLRAPVPPLRGLPPGSVPPSVCLLPQSYPPTRLHNFTPATESAEGRSRPLSSGANTLVSGNFGLENAVLPCGGHCVALETCCHHLLRVAFVTGTLAGICLIVAGSALRSGGRSEPDLSVLTYIGAMVSLVSGLLLAIQCCSKPRIRSRRPRVVTTHLGTVTSNHTLSTLPRQEEIQLQPMQPLLTTLQRHAQIVPPHEHDSCIPCRNDSGIPWWRRGNESAA